MTTSRFLLSSAVFFFFSLCSIVLLYLRCLGSGSPTPTDCGPSSGPESPSTAASRRSYTSTTPTVNRCRYPTQSKQPHIGLYTNVVPLWFGGLILCCCNLKVVEMYSSGGDLHLELPTGQQGGTGKLWVRPLVPTEPEQRYRKDLSRLSLPLLQEIPPFETKGVMRASFSSRDVDNHTAFIRIKTSAPDEDQFIILPVEVEVTSGASTYLSPMNAGHPLCDVRLTFYSLLCSSWYLLLHRDA